MRNIGGFQHCEGERRRGHWLRRGTIGCDTAAEAIDGGGPLPGDVCCPDGGRHCASGDFQLQLSTKRSLEGEALQLQEGGGEELRSEAMWVRTSPW